MMFAFKLLIYDTNELIIRARVQVNILLIARFTATKTIGHKNYQSYTSIQSNSSRNQY